MHMTTMQMPNGAQEARADFRRMSAAPWNPCYQVRAELPVELIEKLDAKFPNRRIGRQS